MRRKFLSLTSRIGGGDPFPVFELAWTALQAGLPHEAHPGFVHVAGTSLSVYSDLSRLFAAAIEDDRAGVERILHTSTLGALALREARTSGMVASCLARVSETESAFVWLEHAVTRWFINDRFLGEYDAWLAPLRAEARFGALMERARLMQRELEVLS